MQGNVKSSSRQFRSRLLVLSSLLFGLMYFLVACQPIQPTAAGASSTSTEATIPEVIITASDSAFDMPAEIPAGLVSLTLKIEGEAGHHAIIMRLKDGVTMQQVTDALGQPDGDSSPLEDMELFMPDTDPGRSNEVTLELAPGNWVIFSVSMSEDMVPDFAKGMLNEFKVVDSGQPAATPPSADLVVTISDADFDMPGELDAGQHTIQVKNASGAENGYLFFLELRGGTTVEEILAMFEIFFSGSMPEVMPEFSAVGGLMTNSVGDTFWTTLDLAPGNYAAISSIGGTDFPYSGLAKTFTVK